MEERNEVTQKILNITLEILYLLTGEDYIIVKKPGGRTPNSNRLQVVEGFCRKQSDALAPPPPRVTSNRSDEKILELTNQIAELLTGEVPIRCQDVSVYLSMEEWEYLEGHKDLYKDLLREAEPRAPDSGGCENRGLSAEVPMVTEDGVMSDGGPGTTDTCDGDPWPGGIHACNGDMSSSSAPVFQIKIKEEPVSSEEDDAELRPYHGVHIKEEPRLFEEVPGGDTHAQHIKEEVGPAVEDSGMKEEPGPCMTVLDTPTGHTHASPETLAYEVEIPMDKVPGQGADSASLYSVRQKEDSMEILYHCPSCYKGFSSNLDLARHQVIHTVDKLFICSLCGKSFTEMSFLVKHQVIHTDLKLCVCSVCGGCFYSETSLAKHQKTHSLPLFCSTCGKCFFNKTELAIHERKHSGERPFGCHVCGKHFIAKSVLNKHLLTHPAGGGKK